MMGVGLGLQEMISRHRRWLAMLVILLFAVYFMVTFGEQALRAQQLEAEVTQQRQAIAQIEEENEQLAAELEGLESTGYQAYVERIARRDLGLARPGDTVVLVRWQGESDLPAPQAEPAPPNDDPNWRRWLDALFGGDG